MATALAFLVIDNDARCATQHSHRQSSSHCVMSPQVLHLNAYINSHVLCLLSCQEGVRSPLAMLVQRACFTFVPTNLVWRGFRGQLRARTARQTRKYSSKQGFSTRSDGFRVLHHIVWAVVLFEGWIQLHANIHTRHMTTKRYIQYKCDRLCFSPHHLRSYRRA